MSSYFLYILFFILGLCLGSFLNALEYRLHTHQAFFRSRSHCPQCKVQLAWYDNIPLLSFFILRQKCRTCKGSISWQYPLIELWMGLTFVGSYFLNSVQALEFNVWQLVLTCFIIFVLTFIFLYDLKYLEVVDSIVIPATLIVYFVSWFLDLRGWQDMVIGMSVGAGFFLVQYLISKGTWIGGGDMRIGLLMGAILGWKLLLVALWFAYVAGALISVGLLISKKKKMKSAIPFGIFLAPATLVVMVWGQQALDWYLSFLKF
ncbi:MAG: prepilin peptidase [Candidatus Magasanikbacteria bacterium]